MNDMITFNNRTYRVYVLTNKNFTDIDIFIPDMLVVFNHYHFSIAAVSYKNIDDMHESWNAYVEHYKHFRVGLHQIESFNGEIIKNVIKKLEIVG
jgi:hypothetical protein